ncbi:glycosyltransferase [Lacinutrix sp. MEBiC02404]
MSVKVVQLFHTYPLFFQPYIPPVLELLKQHSKIDLNIMHYKGEDSGNEIKIPSYRARKVRDKFNSFVFNNKKNYLERFCLKSDVDVLHIMDSFLFDKILNLVELSPNERPKIIMTMRGSDTYVKPLVYDKWKLFYKAHASKIDCFITMSINQKERLMEFGIESNKIEVIPISINSSFESINKKKDTNCIRLLSVFRLVWEKNIEGNLRVIKLLKEQGYNVRYDIYGSGHMLGELLFLIHKYDIKECVYLHGKVSNEELIKGIHGSDIYLQLSHSESLGMAVIEAQSVGLPAVIANSGGLPETICNGKSGYVVDSWDSELASRYILKLWKDTKLYEQFSKASIDNSSVNFSNSLEVSRLVELYARVVSS